MTKYREILRLKGLGFSKRNIALSVPCSRNTVSKVLKRAEERGISWPLPDSMTDGDLEKQLSPSAPTAASKRMPGYAYIRKELLKSGVSKKLLWIEYMEDCRQTGEYYPPWEPPVSCLRASGNDIFYLQIHHNILWQHTYLILLKNFL